MRPAGPGAVRGQGRFRAVGATETTVVLVHGGGATGRTWDRLVPRLESGGATVLAVDLPGRGDHPADLGTITVDDEVASVVADVRAATGPSSTATSATGATGPSAASAASTTSTTSATGPTGPTSAAGVVLVAHSSGGLVVPGVVAALRDTAPVAHVVLIAALVPPEGGNGLDCMKPAHREGLEATVRQAAADGSPPITLPGAPADPEPFRHAYGGDPLTDEELAFVVDPARCVPDTVHHYFQPVRWSQAGDVPVTYVHTLRDRPVRPDAQRTFVDRLRARDGAETTVVELDTGHLPMVTVPDTVATIVAGVLSAGSRAAGR